MGSSGFGPQDWVLRRLQLLRSALVVRTSQAGQRPTEYQVVVAGSAGVGKSSLMQRWARGTFGSAHPATVENTYCRLRGCDHGVTTLRVTDSASGHHNPAMQRQAVTEGHAFILLYSVTKRETLEELKPFYELIRKIKGRDLCRVPILLVGNKSDALGREVALTDGATCASEWNCAFMEISAKMEVNVQELFHVLLTQKKMFAACFQGPRKKSHMPKATEKLLGKCIVM
ncbi:GTP-binding protein Di-Ras3 [Nycticebus coucang]|uniref:GTP-binding protein Di-Ras3 n=1 Tax=Nycticebus coucang TaxID=9470 RepID=UPI00234C1646|nr:GTP-binding protein Di-Ras3 [Nycticebus coucang]XP_053446938.1 GTP-binding protein Di-Ras3 [Nycticebus coucang]XP_053446939.1 GTP-binding protein Di-Ras3 [Nycticebus coucang]XP_053446940.1 GTP-binding protein Di-Ras3 [Nycticebus coucang]